MNTTFSLSRIVIDESLSILPMVDNRELNEFVHENVNSIFRLIQTIDRYDLYEIIFIKISLNQSNLFHIIDVNQFELNRFFHLSLNLHHKHRHEEDLDHLNDS